DGAPVGTGPTYVVQPGDFGRHLSVRTTASMKSYGPATSVTKVPDAVFTKPVVTFTAKPRKGAAVVKVRVQAAGVSGLSGPVKVGVAARGVLADLVDGRARVRVTALKRGTRKVRVKSLADAPTIRGARAV